MKLTKYFSYKNKSEKFKIRMKIKTLRGDGALKSHLKEPTKLSAKNTKAPNKIKSCYESPHKLGNLSQQINRWVSIDEKKNLRYVPQL